MTSERLIGLKPGVPGLECEGLTLIRQPSQRPFHYRNAARWATQEGR
jgi:hypothetical protein